MISIKYSTGRRIVKAMFWLGFLYGAWRVMGVDYDPIGIIRPFLWGGLFAVSTAGVLSLLKRY